MLPVGLSDVVLNSLLVLIFFFVLFLERLG